MSDRFYRIPIERLYKWIAAEEKEGCIFGLYKQLFFTPNENDKFRITRYGRMLETPIGVAAGPQSQLAHNIIASWLCGARFIELKTVQTLDEIEVTKPCIDMEDEGYNCEWSQELKIQDSFNEYLNAWIIIHLLKHKFKWNTKEAGFIFNLSVGYNLNGILNPNVQWFFDKMNNCTEEKEEKIAALESLYPQIRDIEIPDRISDNITLSTMHGCPSDEIEKIGKYLIENRKLHTAIKLNPTLLGPYTLRNILNEKLGYEITVPDEAFDHDLKYDDALKMINSLQQSAEKNGVEFALKLTNTLESLNSTHWLPKNEKMVYTSGRALHPLSINLAAKLQNEFNGKLDISFSAGVDAFNVSDTISCGLTPVTVCSDLLKPGGYLRLTQYLEEINKNIETNNARDIDSFIINKASGKDTLNDSALINLNKYADQVLQNKYYKKSNFPYDNIKTTRKLTEYDCIHSPCIDTCAVDQNVPEYMYYTTKGDFVSAFKVILKDNPLPNITGNVCDHLCQSKCTRINYDNPLLIRGIKRFISEYHKNNPELFIKNKNGLKAAVIGAGPSGLSCAYFLAIEGYEVNVYESKSKAGGMVSDSIPVFRLTDEQIQADIDIIKSIGVRLHYSQHVNKEFFSILLRNNDYIYIAVGAQDSKKLNIPGENLPGVFDQLTFLSRIRDGKNIEIGKQIAIIGGGLSAVDAARTANRIMEDNGKVTMLYRRTQKEMPVGDDEIAAMLEEGIDLVELTAPISISYNNSDLKLTCTRMELGEPDDSGRRKPVVISGSEFDLTFDTIITAIGQEIVIDFLDGDKLIVNPETNETQIKNVYAGGDVLRGADSLINAMGDGRKVAETIIQQSVDCYRLPEAKLAEKMTPIEFQKKQAYRVFGNALPEINVDQRKGFDLVHPVLDAETAKHEAGRCLYCEDLCNICVGVCPNFSNVSYPVERAKIPVWFVRRTNNKLVKNVVDYFTVKQGNQIFNIGDFCNECGNCDTFCPTNGAPYKTKPHFYLTEESFNSEETGYYLNSNMLKFKSNGDVETLALLGNKYFYETNRIKSTFDINDFMITEIEFKSNSICEFKFDHAAEMCFLLKSLQNFSIFNYHRA